MSTKSKETAQRLAFAVETRRFRLRFLAVVLALLVIAGGLGAANVVQGPRLSSAEINPSATTTLSGQRLLLRANQAVGAIEDAQLTISPYADATLTSDGSTITVTFAHPLRYNTEYAVTIEGARSASTGAESSIRYAFETPDAVVYTVNRGTTGAAPIDSILRHTLSGSTANEVVFEARGIQEYAALATELIVVTRDDKQLPTLVAASLSDSSTHILYAGSAAQIRELHSSASANMVGFVAEGSSSPGGRAYESTLFIYDRSNLAAPPTEVTGLSGEPLHVADWVFVPGTTSIVVQDRDSQLYLIEILGGVEPKPLGQHAELRGFVPGTVTLIVANPDGGSVIDLANGTSKVLALAEPQLGPGAYPGDLVTLSADSYIQSFNEVDLSSAATPIRSMLYRVGPDGTKDLYRPASDSSRIRSLCLAPNGQLVAVDVANDASSDGGQSQAGAENATNFFIDTANGSVTRSVIGTQSSWCG